MKSDEQFLHERVSGEITFHIMKGVQTFTEDGFQELLRGITQIAEKGGGGDDFDEWLAGEINKIRRGVRLWMEGAYKEAEFTSALLRALEFPGCARFDSMQDLQMRICEVLGIPGVGWASYIE